MEKRPLFQMALSSCFPAVHAQKMASPDFSDDLISLNGKPFMVKRNPFYTMGQISGYCLTFDSASQIRKNGDELSRKLKTRDFSPDTILTISYIAIRTWSAASLWRKSGGKR